MTARLPAALGQGARLYIWAPSSPAPVQFPQRFKRAIEALEACGYGVEIGESCKRMHGSSTRPPGELAEELHAALASPNVDGVLAAVGGWTMLPVLSHIRFPDVVNAAKPIIGYSDTSVLLNVVASSGLVTFHGPMAISEFGEHGGPWPYTLEMLQCVTRQGQGDVVIETAGRSTDELLWWDRDDDRPRHASTSSPYRVLQHGVGEGPLWGGSLRAVSLLAGSPFWRVPKDAVVFLEDDNVAPDELWARMEQLRLAGTFEWASALVMGRISRPIASSNGNADFAAIVKQVVPHLPILGDVDLGHTEPMCTLPLGAQARVTCLAGQVEFRLLGPFTS